MLINMGALSLPRRRFDIFGDMTGGCHICFRISSGTLFITAPLNPLNLWCFSSKSPHTVSVSENQVQRSSLVKGRAEKGIKVVCPEVTTTWRHALIGSFALSGMLLPLPLVTVGASRIALALLMASQSRACWSLSRSTAEVWGVRCALGFLTRCKGWLFYPLFI